MADLLDKMIPGAERLAALPSGHILCCKCLKSAPVDQCQKGDPSLYGRGGHIDHYYAPCGHDLTWHGGIQKLANGKLQRAS